MSGTKRPKRRRAAIAALAAVLTAAAVFGVSYLSGPVFYPAFYHAASLGDAIPVDEDGFVPQGVTAVPGGSERIVCGYMTGDAPSRIYVLRPDGARTRIDLKTEDGGDYTGHAGGLTAAGRYLYVSNAHKLFVLRLDDVLDAADGATLAFIGHADVDVNASYCSSDGQYLYVGEYHAEGYETDESHLTQSADGEYRAFTLALKLDENAPLGLAEPVEPVRVFAHRDCVQGFAHLGNGVFALSCSRALENSHLYLYDVSDTPAGDAPVALDSGNQTGEIRMPRMSEDLECRDGQLLMSFEAASGKFAARLLPFAVRRIAVFDADALVRS